MAVPDSILRAFGAGPWPVLARGGARGIIHARGRRIAATRGFEATMFRVDVKTLEAYFAFDPKREGDLRRLDALISQAAPSLKRHFHKGTPAGEPTTGHSTFSPVVAW
jgi:hypothetical protein